MTEFIVESQGHCFLCLNKITNDFDPNHITFCNPSSSQIYSLHSLSRYLKLDMGIVFHETRDNIPEHLIAKVRKSKLKSELCQVCADLSQRLSVLHHQLEKIEMEVISNLNIIHQRIVEAGETDLSQKLSSVSELTDELTEKVKIADVLRTETMQKCSQKLETVRPNVKVRKMTATEIKLTEERTRSRIQRKSNRDYSQKSDLETGSIKMETVVSDMEGFQGHDDDSFQPTYFTTEEDGQDESKFKVSMECVVCHIQVSDLSSHHCQSAQDHSSFGRISRSVLSKAARNKKTYICRICQKKFSSSSNCSRHYIAVHQGKTFSCQFCRRVFTQAGHRNLHMRKTCPKRKMNKVEVNN